MFTRLAIITFLVQSPLLSQSADDGFAFFEKHIRPLFAEYCYDCHSTSTKRKGGLLLDSKKGIEIGGDRGAVIFSGQPDISRLIEAVRYQNRELQMPPKNPLPPNKVTLLEQWVAMGAPDPRISQTTPEASPSGMNIEDGKNFWSFRPLSPVTPPQLSSPFVRNPIDAFVLEKLNQKGLTPAAAADRSTLIRRLTQNLIGLPPTPAEIEAFISDPSPRAFDRVVERLLSSPHYGVRWGRHWLDVARYADSNGLDENIGLGNAWRYRDYIVDAFNEDKPYDQLIIEQLAGDLLDSANEKTITATGYLQLGPKVLAEPDLEKLHLDIIDEQIDTVGKTFLGMTLGCARCHDHKFDPIKQKDYYALAAIFKSTKTIGNDTMGAIKFWHEHPIATEADREHIEKINAQLKKLQSTASSFKNQAIAKLRSEAQSKAVDYLVACTEFSADTSLDELLRVAKRYDLHPRILHHCRQHLHFHRDDSFFSAWHRWAAESDLTSLKNHYSKLFKNAEQALAAAKEKDPKTKTRVDPELETAQAALHDKAGFLAIPTVDAFAFDADTLAQYYDLLDKARAFESSAPDLPAVMSVADSEIVTTIPVLMRGNPSNPGPPVERAFPEALSWSDQATTFSSQTSGRLELARWIAAPKNPLTARVMVNRIWAWHFGQGLVSSTENFGIQGAPPTHAALLDWLAHYLVESGWSIKAMHRLILASSTWQMDSTHAKASNHSQVDPENRYLWKQNIRRLEAEQIRDSLLAVSGRLNPLLGGKTLPLRNRQFVFNHTSEDHTNYDSLRRAIYLPVIRNNLYAWFEQFDFPDPTMPTGIRRETVIAPQALVMLNDSLVLDAANAMAQALIQEFDALEDRLLAIYHRCLGRAATHDELNRGRDFIENLGSTNSEADAWSVYCQSILVSNEFLYLK